MRTTKIRKNSLNKRTLKRRQQKVTMKKLPHYRQSAAGGGFKLFKKKPLIGGPSIEGMHKQRERSEKLRNNVSNLQTVQQKNAEKKAKYLLNQTNLNKNNIAYIDEILKYLPSENEYREKLLEKRQSTIESLKLKKISEAPPYEYGPRSISTFESLGGETRVNNNIVSTSSLSSSSSGNNILIDIGNRSISNRASSMAHRVSAEKKKKKKKTPKKRRGSKLEETNITIPRNISRIIKKVKRNKRISVKQINKLVKYKSESPTTLTNLLEKLPKEIEVPEDRKLRWRAMTTSIELAIKRPETEAKDPLVELFTTEKTYLKDLDNFSNKYPDLKPYVDKLKEVSVEVFPPGQQNKLILPRLDNIKKLKKIIEQIPDNYIKLLKKKNKNNTANKNTTFFEGNPLVIMQRFTRYPLLFKELIKKTLEKKHRDGEYRDGEYDRLKQLLKEEKFDELKKNKSVEEIVERLQQFEEITKYLQMKTLQKELKKNENLKNSNLKSLKKYLNTFEKDENRNQEIKNNPEFYVKALKTLLKKKSLHEKSNYELYQYLKVGKSPLRPNNFVSKEEYNIDTGILNAMRQKANNNSKILKELKEQREAARAAKIKAEAEAKRKAAARAAEAERAAKTKIQSIKEKLNILKKKNKKSRKNDSEYSKLFKELQNLIKHKNINPNNKQRAEGLMKIIRNSAFSQFTGGPPKSQQLESESII